MRIKFYQKQSGKNPVAEFLNDLPSDEIARLAGCLKMLKNWVLIAHGYNSGKLKARFGKLKLKHRAVVIGFFMCAFKKEIIVLLHAYKKQSQKAPKQEIELAEKRMMEVYENESTYLK